MEKKVLIQLGIFVLVVGVVLTSVLRLQAAQRDVKQRPTSRDFTLAVSSLISFPRFDASPSPSPGVTNPSALLHVQGTQLVDASGHSVLLRGAQIESPFARMKAWQRGKSISKNLNSAVFSAMAQDWKMNVLRLPISNWIYALDPMAYLSRLDQVVQEANVVGLYVVLDLHDNARSGSPYGDGATLPKAESIPFWKAIASHYKDNSMVLFDVFNEPKAKDWQTWLHGGGMVSGAKIVGVQDLIDAIRSVGAQQVIIVEPGSAGGNRPMDAGWATFGNNAINDANIMYSLHVYHGITYPVERQDAKWGPILNHHPIYYGEWALLPNAYNPHHCQGIAPNLADTYVINFLNYMASRHANWTAWEFTPNHLIQNTTNFTPTTLDVPWTCGDTTSHAGMGTLVKQFLANG